jgi:hypothetical protein
VKRSELSRWLLFGALTGSALLGCKSETAKAASVSTSKHCGAKGQTPCPLQALMDARLSPDLKARRIDDVAKGLKLVADLEPAGYTRWREIANAGALAAQQGDLEGARKSCGKCHDLYRKKYRSELRNRPLPQAAIIGGRQ